MKRISTFCGDVHWTLTPALFARKASRGRWKMADHLMLLDRAILQTLNGDGGIRRLIVTMPPRHGKSELCCKYLPAWFLGTHPHKRVLLAAYGERFAGEWGQKARDLMFECGPALFRVRVRPTQSALDNWGLEGNEGSMKTAGVGGTITGRGADLLIVDDPIKNEEEANSPTYRQKIWNWWIATASTRLEPGAAAIVIQTRWNWDDLVGRLLRAEQEGNGPEWRIVNLPALSSDGVPLWPDRFSRETLEGIRREKGEYWWSALYQQNPTPREGLFFKVSAVEIVDAVPAGLRVVRAWDNAASSGRGDFTVGVKMGRAANGLFYVLDVVRGQWASEERDAIIRQTAQLDGREVTPRGVQDPGSAGVDSARQFRNLLVGFAAQVRRVSGSKVSRADPLAAQLNGGNVKLLRAGWNRDFLQELQTFPHGTHDDQVDAAADAFNELCRPRSLVVGTGEGS